jgi:hypothetical protein
MDNKKHKTLKEKIRQDKDIQQLQKTLKGIEKKYPLFSDIIKSFLIIIKWLIFILACVFIFMVAIALLVELYMAIY